MKKILLSIIFVLLIVVLLLPHNVFAVNLAMYVKDGVLYWDHVTDSGCKGYDIYIYDYYYENEIAHHETSQRLASSFRIKEVMDSLKVDSGRYYANIRLKGISGSDWCSFSYKSPYQKLEAPTNLRWDGTTAKWNSVQHADKYEVELYSSHANLYDTFTVTGTSKNFGSLDVVADGWYFKVRAISTGDYRNSNMNESPKRGSTYHTGIWAKTGTGTLAIKTFENGYISWTSKGGQTFDIYVKDAQGNTVLEHEETQYNCNFNLASLLNAEKVDSGKLTVSIESRASEEYDDRIEIEYLSPYQKLEAPTNLRWDGNTVKWNSVANASVYRLALYNDDGNYVGSETYSADVTQVNFDAYEFDPGAGAFFMVFAYSEGDYRSSVSNESPTKPLPFKDIPIGSWYYDSVKYVSERGLITGYNDTTFGPFDNLKREQLVNILWRIAGKPDASELPNNFTDVPNGEWYTDAIKWANANGIVNGYGGTKLFGRGDNIKRQDLAIMLSNFAKFYDCYTAPTGTLDKFADKEKVSDYAVDAVRWASENGIISGNLNEDGSRTIDPMNNARRCEAAVMLTRFCQNVIHYDLWLR